MPHVTKKTHRRHLWNKNKFDRIDYYQENVFTKDALLAHLFEASIHELYFFSGETGAASQLAELLGPVSACVDP